MMNFKTILNNHLPFSENTVDNMLTNWAENKFHFASTDLFNEEYQILEPVSIVVEDYKRMAKNAFINAFRYPRGHKILVNLEDLTIEKDELGEFPKGMKISRVISRGLADEYLKDTLDHRIYDNRTVEEYKKDIVNEMSQMVQKSLIKGSLYISANPIDYLTMSENAAGWSSCHGLDGGYAAGTVSYMQDEHTFIAGLVSGKKQKFEDSNGNEIEWYSKQWRAVVYMNKRGYVIGRQYPFRSQELLDTLSKMIEEKFFAGKEFIDGKTYAEGKGVIYLDSSEVSKSVKVEDGSQQNRNCITVGESSVCRDCGCEYWEGDVDCAAFTCMECSGVGGMYCECCDDRMSEDYACWIEGTHEYVCENCREYHYAYCENCDEYYHENDVCHVTDGATGNEKCLCSSCFEDKVQSCEECGDQFFDGGCSQREEQDYRCLCDDCFETAEKEDAEEIEIDKDYQLKKLGACLMGFSIGDHVKVLYKSSEEFFAVQSLSGIIGYAKKEFLRALN